MATEHILDWFGANVRTLRETQNLTQQELAETLRVDPRYVRRVESGEVNVGLITVAKFANALGVEPARLIEQAALQRRKAGRPKIG